MAVSRIFVRNLPPSLTEDEFRTHFSKGGRQVTDSKLLQHRRFGYVGYKTPEDATKAVKYFNKSFIRMSKIAVELARPVSDETLPDRNRHSKLPEQSRTLETQASTKGNLTNTLKRKRGGNDEEGNPKLKEFLGVMQSTKPRTWQNLAMEGIEDTVTESPKVDDLSDEELQTIGKTSTTNIPSKSKNPLRDVEMIDVSVPVVDATENTSKGGQPILGQSDDDWIRSRTSRLLDLEDEDERAARLQDRGDDSASEDAKTTSKVDIDVPEDLPDDNEQTEADESELESKLSLSRGRLFLRNLPFSVTEDELGTFFATYGTLEEVHVSVNKTSKAATGYAFLQYSTTESAMDALTSMDGKIFQGRLLQILPALPKRDNNLDEFAISKLPLKQQMKIRRRMEASTATFKWNPLYMNMDDVMSSISTRLGVQKSSLLDHTSADAAVKQALAETHIIQEAKSYFIANGVDLNAFKPGQKRGDTAILIKNFPHGTNPDEIRNMFSPHGQITRLLMPPSGTMALVEFSSAPEGRAAFDALKYRRVKDSILFLEKAPKDVFTTVPANVISPAKQDLAKSKLSTADLLHEASSQDSLQTSTLFVSNLNFVTTTEQLRETFAPLAGLISARVKTKPDAKRPGQLLSMGIGFLEFRTKADAQAALATMDGHVLDGHRLKIRPSQKAIDIGEEHRKEDKAKSIARTKIIIRNLPFETNKKDVRALFGAYGELRSVRVPKKFDSTARGFAFAEFKTAREAASAMSALRDTHLLGRRLNLEYASADAVDAEEEIEKMQKKVRSQVNKVALQKLTGANRRKFNVAGNDPEEN